MSKLKYITLFSMLANVAWFFWNPNGWKFEWEPIVTFFGLFGTYVFIDVKSKKKYSAKKNNIGHNNDINLFKELQKILPSDGPILFIREHDFGGSFDLEHVMPFKKFNYFWTTAEYEFIDQELEELKKNLLKASNAFSQSIAINTSPNKHGFQSVIPTGYDYSEESEKRIRGEIDEMNQAADELFKAHQEIIRAGRKKLNLSD